MSDGTTIRVEKPGLLATIQDRGRFGHAHEGISACGAADPLALRLGNRLVGNDANAAAIEMTLVGGTFTFERESLIAVTGADFAPRLAGNPMPLWEAVVARAGDRLECGASRSGARAYLCVAGGIDVPQVLGSRSTHLRSRLGGIDGRALGAADRLPTGATSGSFTGGPRRIDPESIRKLYAPTPFRVTSGPQAGEFSPQSQARLTDTTWTMREQSDRMGIRLSGPPLVRRTNDETWTEGVPLGAIQVPADGQPIVLFVDRGTTGGYPKIANVCSADLHRLGQLRPRDSVRFESVTFDDAAALLAVQERLVRELEARLAAC